MPRKIDRNYNAPSQEDVLEDLPNDETFFIGEDHEDRAVTTLSCKKCGSKNFNVGQGIWSTAIKCVNCDWQTCIHEG